MAQPAIDGEAKARSKTNERLLRIPGTFAFPFVIAGLADSGSGAATKNGLPNPQALPVTLTEIL